MYHSRLRFLPPMRLPGSWVGCSGGKLNVDQISPIWQGRAPASSTTVSPAFIILSTCLLLSAPEQLLLDTPHSFLPASTQPNTKPGTQVTQHKLPVPLVYIAASSPVAHHIPSAAQTLICSLPCGQPGSVALPPFAWTLALCGAEGKLCPGRKTEQHGFHSFDVMLLCCFITKHWFLYFCPVLKNVYGKGASLVPVNPK